MLPSGDPSVLRSKLNFPSGFISQVLNLIIESWVKLAPPPHPKELENQITARLRELLCDEYTCRGLPWMISLEEPVVVRQTGETPNRTDIRFFHREIPGQRVFFVVETKRLNIPNGTRKVSSNAGAYVKEGMVRFINGEYSSGLDSAAMIGYVMNGNAITAQHRVNMKIKKEATLLCCNGTASIIDCISIIPADMGAKRITDALPSMVVH